MLNDVLLRASQRAARAAADRLTGDSRAQGTPVALPNRGLSFSRVPIVFASGPAFGEDPFEEFNAANWNLSQVPEPATLALMGLGLGLAGGRAGSVIARVLRQPQQATPTTRATR